MLPRDKSYAERFGIAKEAGFEAVEMQTITADAEAAEIKASTKTGLKIHSVMNSDHWRYPLSSADRGGVEERQWHGDVDQECGALGRRGGAAGAGGGRSRNLVRVMRGRDRSG